MNCQEIKTKALILSGLRDMPDEYVLSYTNEILTELAIKYDTACRKETTNVYGLKGHWIDLPYDCIAVRRCIHECPNVAVADYIVENQQIRFDREGVYRIEYLTPYCKVKEMTDRPRLNMLYHDAICYGVAFKETNRIFVHEDMIQGNNKYLLFQEYTVKAEDANAKLSTMKRSKKRIHYPDFT